MISLILNKHRINSRECAPASALRSTFMARRRWCCWYSSGVNIGHLTSSVDYQDQKHLEWQTEAPWEHVGMRNMRGECSIEPQLHFQSSNLTLKVRNWIPFCLKKSIHSKTFKILKLWSSAPLQAFKQTAEWWCRVNGMETFRVPLLMVDVNERRGEKRPDN